MDDVLRLSLQSGTILWSKPQSRHADVSFYGCCSFRCWGIPDEVEQRVRLKKGVQAGLGCRALLGPKEAVYAADAAASQKLFQNDGSHIASSTSKQDRSTTKLALNANRAVLDRIHCVHGYKWWRLADVWPRECLWLDSNWISKQSVDQPC